MSTFGVRVVVKDKGGPEKLIVEKFKINKPRDNEIIIRVIASGVNFIDTYHRSGLYPNVNKIGLEGSGIIIACGKNAKLKYNIGDAVCWIMTSGSYSTHLITSIKNKNIMIIPQSLFKKYNKYNNNNNNINVFKYCASILSQGLTAHYLCRDLYKVCSSDTVLIHAGAGGTGGLLIQICKNICNAKCIITTCSNLKKKQIALENGAHHVILYKQDDFYEKVMEITNKKGCDVVFDGVGKVTATKSLKCVKRRGMMVYFGNASGAVPSINPLSLTKQGSVFMTRPTLGDYCKNQKEKQNRINDLLSWIQQNKIKIRIGAEYPLKNAMQAHQDLEQRQTTGKIILLPSHPNNSKL